MMTTTKLTALPFALPRYGNAREKNEYFVKSAGAYLWPMRTQAFATIERLGGVPVHTNTRPHNLEFLVANGQHFIQIMQGLGIKVTHMLPVVGGYKCYKDGNAVNSICFIQKRTERGSGAITYTAVLPMRDNALELLNEAWSLIQVQVPAEQVVPVDPFLANVPQTAPDSFLPAPPEVGFEEPTYHPAMPDHPSLVTGIHITEHDLPAGM